MQIIFHSDASSIENYASLSLVSVLGAFGLGKLLSLHHNLVTESCSLIFLVEGVGEREFANFARCKPQACQRNCVLHSIFNKLIN